MSEPPPLPPPQNQNTSTVQEPLLITPYTTSYQTQTHHHSPSSNLREYRKGNWTLEETLTLITAKRLNDERRRINNVSSRTTGELRWKWVENYCWLNGCLRSQTQCNDKWDNLLRDYKKVREYQVSLSSTSSSSNNNNNPSYWEMDRNQRKNLHLPSNLILRIYEALNEVVQRKYPSPPTFSSIQSQPMTMLPLPPQPPLPPGPPPSLPSPLAAPQSLGNSASDSSETNGSEEGDDYSLKAKRRKLSDDIESVITRSTSVLAQTLMNCEEKREKLHREMMALEEKKIKVEETRNEMNMQMISSLINSVNNLSTAIHGLISDRRDK